MAARQTKTADSGNRKATAAKSRPQGGTKKSSSSQKRTAGKATAAKKGASGGRQKKSASAGDVDYRQRSGMYDEIEMIIALAISILLLLSIYNLCGAVGSRISYFIFGVFGGVAYVIPYMVFFGTAFYISNRSSRVAVVKIIAGIVVFISVTAFLQMLSNPGENYVSVFDFYEDSAVYKNGGGLIGGAICRLLAPLFGIAGTYLIIIALFAVSVVLLAGKSVFVSIFIRLQKAAAAAARRHREHQALLDEARQQRRLEAEAARMARTDSAGGAEELDDFEDIDDLEIDGIGPEAGDASNIVSLAGRRKKRRRKMDGTGAMIEPQTGYGKPLSPLGFELPKAADEAADADGSKALSEDAAAAERAGTKASLSDEGIAAASDVSGGKAVSEAAAAAGGNASAELPELTITRMQDIQDMPDDFDFTPDPVYLEPESNLPKLKLPDIEVPEFMQKNQKASVDPFEKTMELPKVTIGEFPEELMTAAPQNGAGANILKERTIEEKYTNLPEYTPGEAPLSPADAVREAAKNAAGTGGPGAAAKTSGGTAAGSRTSGSHRQTDKIDKAAEPVTEAELVPEVKEYVFPPMDLLKRGKPMTATEESDRHLKETAKKLQETLESFGVRVHVTNVSCGPAVTRYELSPEQGVKVSRILSLTDDIKLNLAVADIRIEAPIPGKAAIGIEVPNKENTTVMLRDLFESSEFKTSKSQIAFAVGRDIGGQVIIADIAKMPHLLIAGATGSGKSVCINTLIMSIIYKEKPEDVRMIMIDPKVVELSVYNGIPHLLIPVVTDPKKAAGALNWAVAEMEKRYKKFAELNVRDMKSYNAKIESCEYESEDHKRLPQIVIIVDELADLMMVASNEVEDAICRLAQLARAAGIHLVIATQRPSVNVITGLIKANVPSRIAFSVSSGVDSRTIIDMNGAEKLLGKGDMLFYPTGYQKPVRVQGAFVSDQEVNAVVEFLTREQSKPVYNEAIVNSISSGKLASEKSAADDRDVYFVEAGRLIIEKEKASIGMLQRVYRIGFNRAARIMDQLCEAGVVGPEEGTKPRKVLMSPEQFEQYVEDYV